MKNIFHINAHEEYAFSPGKLNRSLTDLAVEHLAAMGYEVKTTSMKDDYDIDAEIAKHQGRMPSFSRVQLTGWAFLGHSRNTWTKFTHLGWMDVYVMGMVEHLKTPPFNTVKAEL